MIFKNKTEGKSPKDFRVYQNPVDLFKNLIDGNINTKELLKNQINFKWDLGELKTTSKIKIRISVIQIAENCFDIREKWSIFLEAIIFCYLKQNTKQNMCKSYIWKLTKWNHANYTFFVQSKRNYKESI